MGDPAAPITIVELTDYECPFCKRYVAETRPALVERFVETGVVRLVVRDLPLSELHPSALPAAIAAHCAATQGQFWPMYERLFATHDLLWGGMRAGERELFRDFAAELGLELAAFDACLVDPASEQTVRAEAAAIQGLGISVTPTFFINGQQLRGAQPIGVFERLIAALR